MDSVQTAIDSFREAALTPELWPQALDTLANSLQSDGATLVLGQGAKASHRYSNSLAPFVGDYFKLPYSDPRDWRANPGARDGFMPDLAHFTREEIATDRYYQEFLVPIGLGQHAVAQLHTELLISLKRGVRRGHYDGAELSTLNTVLPWLRAASRAASMAWRSHFGGQLSAFERIGRGALLIDARARVLQTNACMRFGDGLDVSQGVLQVTRAADRPRLHAFLAALLEPDSQRTPPATTLILARPSGRRARILDGIGCPEALRSMHSEGAALILVTDLEHVQRPQQRALMELFGLTPRECELAIDLAAGNSLQSAASRLSMSEAHTRQRLKAIFNKTQTCRQGELIALLSRLPVHR